MTSPTERSSYWYSRVKTDLDLRVARHHTRWANYDKMVRNTDRGFREGNLIQSWVGMLMTRLFSNIESWGALVTSDDPTQQKLAHEVAIIANSLVRVCQLPDTLSQATRDAMWATTGFVEIGHPLSAFPADLMRSYAAPRLLPERPTTGPFEDRYRATALPIGVDTSQIAPFDPFEEQSIDDSVAPTPLVQMDTGYPWLTRVHPAYVVLPMRTSRLETADYVARLRPYTAPEMKHHLGRTPKAGMTHYMNDLYEFAEADDPRFYGGVSFMVELWVRRDRRYPQYNDCLYVFPMGEPEDLFFEGPNPLGGGFWPIIGVHPLKTKDTYDAPIARELETFAGTFDRALRSVQRTVNRNLNRKIMTGPGAGIDPKEAEKLNNDEYNGSVNVQDPASVTAYREEQIDPMFLSIVGWLRGTALSTTGTSEMDQGTPIKNISARQTSALLEASGMQVSSLRQGVSEAAKEAVHKIMYLAQRFGAQTVRRAFDFAGKTVVMDPGSHDYSKSYVFNFEFGDVNERTAEDTLMLTQFLRLLLTDTGGLLVPYLDMGQITEQAVRAMGLPSTVLASRGPNTPPTGARQSADLALERALSGNPLTEQPGPGTSDVPTAAAMGSHPERLAGSRSPGDQQQVANMLAGLERMQ